MAEPTLDRIHIRDLRTECIIGIFPHEREMKQEVTFNITLHANLSAPCASDNIVDTIDYKKLKQRVLAMVNASSFMLIERLADAVAALCLEDVRVARVNVIVDKPGALRFARSVAVEIERARA